MRVVQFKFIINCLIELLVLFKNYIINIPIINMPSNPFKNPGNFEYFSIKCSKIYLYCLRTNITVRINRPTFYPGITAFKLSFYTEFVSIYEMINKVFKF